MIVIDASVALAWSLKDEESDYAETALAAVVSQGAVVPGHWPIEVANGLMSAVRRDRMRYREIAAVRNLIARLGVEVVASDVSTATGPVLDMARIYGLSAYDAAYLHVAKDRGLALATLDTRLRAASEAAAVRLFEE